MMKRFFCVSIVMLSMVAGCHGQIPVSPTPTATVSWSAPTAGCGVNGAGCTYVVLRAAGTSGACPSNSGTTYTQIGTTPAGVLTYSDGTANGIQACWIIQAQTVSTPVLTGPPSGPSNNGTPLSIPAIPLAPGAPNAVAIAAVQSEDAKPGIIEPSKELAANELAPMQVVAKLR